MTKTDRVLPLDLALRAAVQSKGDHSVMQEIATAYGYNLTTFRNALCPTTQTHKANIHQFEAVLAYTKDAGLMDSICSIHGNAVWFELPDVDVGERSYLQKMGELAREQGELSQSVAMAVADDRITPQEFAEIEKKAFDLFNAAAQLLRMAKDHKNAPATDHS